MSFSTFFYPKKNKKNKNNEVPIYCRISTSGKDRVEYYTKIKVDETLWLPQPKRAPNGMTMYIKGSTEKIKSYNKTLNLIEAKIQQKYNDLIGEETIVTAAELKESLTGYNKPDKYTIMYFLEKVFEGRDTHKSRKTVRAHINNLKQFLQREYRVDDIPITALLQKKYLGIDAMLAEWGRSEKGWSKIYANGALNIIRAAVNIAVRQHYITYNPITYRLKLKKSDIKQRETLSFSEVKLLEEYPFARERFDRARDVFLFQAYTGLAYIDVLTLRKENISKGINGQNWIIKKREKTKSLAKIPLIEKAQAILDKYGNYFENKLLPVVDNTAYNRSLEKMMVMLGIDKHITSHCARHTFATLMRESGSDLNNLKQIVAHSHTSMTEHYAQLTSETLVDEVGKFEKKLGT